LYETEIPEIFVVFCGVTSLPASEVRAKGLELLSSSLQTFLDMLLFRSLSSYTKQGQVDLYWKV